MGQRRHSKLAALSLGAALALASPAVAATQAGAAGERHAATRTTPTLPVEAGWLYGVATLPGGHAWAVGYSGTSETTTLTLFWNGTRWQPEPSPSPAGAKLQAVAATSPANVWAVGSSGTGSTSETLILHRSGGKWREMPSIAGGLTGVATTSPTDAWAVGSTDQGGPLILHWNGKTWQQTPGPGVGTLSGVTATSPSDAWVVGETTTGTSTVIYHWNGRTWQQTPSPSVGADQGLASALDGVSAASRHTAWAVGEGDSCGCGPGQSLIARWNGEAWSQVKAPNNGGMSLTGVTALASGRAWAVGVLGEGDSPTTSGILQWNGSSWVQVPIPGLAGDEGGLFGVAATSRTDAWAVGWENVNSGNSDGGEGDTGNPDILILHWNGSTWTPLTRTGPAGASAATGAATTPTTTPTPTTNGTAPPSSTTPSSGATPAGGGPLLGSAAWGQALGQYSGISGFGEAAPTGISLGGVATSPQVQSITWSNWGAAEATGQGKSIYGTGQSGPASSWPVEPVTVVAYDLGSCNGGPPAYQEVTWYFPGEGQTFDPNSGTNTCTGM